MNTIPANREVKFNHGGVDVTLNVFPQGDLMSDIIVNNGTFFEEPVLHHISRMFPVQGNILDIGASFGNHSVFFANYLKRSGRVFAVEPYPPAATLLRMNAARYTNDIVVVQQALCDENGKELTIVTPPPGNQGMAQVCDVPEDADDVAFSGTVKGVMLDQLVRNMRIDDITLIKIDAEGMEPAILMGGLHTIRYFKPTIFAECLTPHAFHMTMNLLATLGYVCVYSPSADDPTFQFVHRSNR